jgi:exopolyphosphatase/guanosine-5'-triphosphate,3'-diphosphate pyrophosphatase
LHKKPTRKKAIELVAVIDIGSSAIRMVVAEMHGPGSWKVIDGADQPVGLGRDVFLSGTITRASATQTLQILQAFLEQIAGWQIKPENITAIGTSALREAQNRDMFVDKIALRTGLEISIIEGVEANRLTYIAVRNALRMVRPGFSRANSVIIEVGGGSTEVMLLHAGRMVAAHTLNTGTVRLETEIKTVTGFGGYLERFLREHVRSTLETLDTEFKLKRVKTFVAVGGDARLAAHEVGREIADAYHVVDKAAFEKFLRRLQSMSTDECVQRLHISYADAEALVPGLLIYLNFMDDTSATEMIVPTVSIRDGVLLGLSQGTDEFKEEFNSQIIASAISLGNKYGFDEAHGRQTAKLALQIFDHLQSEHGLDAHRRLLLEVAALVHDIGRFVNARDHHRHSEYVVANSEIFGLHENELNVVSNVVRFHRSSPPNKSHICFMGLSTEDRIVVTKLAAILRIADALDRGHQSRIRKIELESFGDELSIRCHPHGDLAGERMALVTCSQMFEDLFGMKIVPE